MLHGLTITVRRLEGRRMGSWHASKDDLVEATYNGETRKLGFVGRFDGACVRLIRHLSEDVREPVRKDIERLRLEQGGFSIAPFMAVIANPKLIEAYERGDLQKSSPTTIVRPDGFPFGDDTSASPTEEGNE